MVIPEIRFYLFFNPKRLTKNTQIVTRSPQMRPRGLKFLGGLNYYTNNEVVFQIMYVKFTYIECCLD